MPNPKTPVLAIPRYMSTINQRIPGEYIGPHERSTVAHETYLAPNNMMMTPEAVAYAQTPRGQQQYQSQANMWSDYMQSMPPMEDTMAPPMALMSRAPGQGLITNNDYWQGQVMADNPSVYVPGYGYTYPEQAAQIQSTPYVDPVMGASDVTNAAIEGRRRPDINAILMARR